MPLATYLALQSNPEEALVLSLVLIVVSFAVLVGLREKPRQSPAHHLNAHDHLNSGEWALPGPLFLF